ncbi:MAG: ATP-binding protein [Sulfuricurvum sp.]|nr:ATP-binding protein [Sulfuricurvum sp.]
MELHISSEEYAFLCNSEKVIVDTWLKHPRMVPLFEKYGMDEPYFREHYGNAVYHSFLEIITQKDLDQPSPSIMRLIDYLKNRDIVVTDLHKFFSLYRQSILKNILHGMMVSAELCDAIHEILDTQFADALAYYNQSFFSKNQALHKELIRFKEYQKAIDKSAIVSKTDPRGVITYVNQAFCDISGYSREELVGKSHSIVRHPDTPPKLFQEMWQSIKSKKIFHATIKNRKKNGDPYYVDATIVPILDDENKISEFIAMRYDVSALVEAVETARLAERAKDEFLANMSHEIRTPLNAISGFIVMLRKYISDEKGLHFLSVIDSSSKMLLDTVNEILDFSKLQSGKFVIHSEPFSPLHDLSTAAALFGSKTLEKHIHYRVYIDPKLPVCLEGDGGRIKQVLANFLSNAIKFTPEKGIIKMKAVYEDGELRVMVQDNGIGIKHEKQEKIFHAFEQADSSITRQYGGTGLGLSICHQLITRMGGEIVFRSVEGKGSLFGFHLPSPICTKEIGNRFDSMRYQFLKVALIEEHDEPELIGLMEKYLIDFGMKHVSYVQNIEIDEWDLVVITASSKQMERMLEQNIPVMVLNSTPVQGYESYPHIEQLNEPFLPNMIHLLLTKIAENRNVAPHF